MRPLLVLFLLCVLLACRQSVSSEPMRTPSGRWGFAIECDRPAQCMVEAGERCPRGYTVLAGGAHVEPNAVAQVTENYSASVGRRPAHDMSEARGDLVIECR